MARRINTIPASLQYKMVDWLREHKDYVAATHPKLIAERAEKKLGFRITENNIRRTCRDLELEYGRLRATSSLTDGVNRTRVREAILAKSILELADALGASLLYENALKIIAEGRGAETVNLDLNGRVLPKDERKEDDE